MFDAHQLSRTQANLAVGHRHQELPGHSQFHVVAEVVRGVDEPTEKVMSSFELLRLELDHR